MHRSSAKMADRDGKETRGTDLQPAPGLRALRVRRLSGEPVCELRVPVSWSDARQQIKEIPRAMQQLLEARKCNSYGSWSSEVAQLRSALAESLPEREQRLIFEGAFSGFQDYVLVAEAAHLMTDPRVAIAESLRTPDNNALCQCFPVPSSTFAHWCVC